MQFKRYSYFAFPYLNQNADLSFNLKSNAL